MIPIYVISVKSFTDRHEHIERLANQFGFSFEYVWRYDADELTDSDLEKVRASLPAESVSNVLKHLHAQKLFLATDCDVSLILEDDVVLFDSFFDELQGILGQGSQLPPGWLIFLGGADNKIDSRFYHSEGQYLVEKLITTAEAYLVDRHGCELRLRWLEENYIDRQADHQLKLMDQNLGIVHYCVSNPIATQGSITGLFETSLDSSRSKHSSMYLNAKYKFNRLRRQILPRYFARLMR